ncbi:sporulation phosphorelay system protein KapB [Paenibacillus protaetiae]|uniref:Kinase n=1 Tax=Paenibacillus protaetiae TaxID=2509456 RepID=A0A4P6EZD4_9BACL|nr:sporulation phosphorelay system protein KapB [Paenibacillus protaetiae]QAY68135.1 kinase [Paenibacillus protaetiae]
MVSGNYAEGNIVTAAVRTGTYIGEITEFYGPRAVVKVLAVLKHPEQGDLHHPYSPDVAIFHERRALAYTEKTTVLQRDLAPYDGPVPDYKTSLAKALDEQLAALQEQAAGGDAELARWAEKSLEQLLTLRSDYKLDR